MPLVINDLRDRYKHANTHTDFPDKTNFKKTGVRQPKGGTQLV